ncbi:hypothetical protein EGH22_14740 [Halomicroarcula sp. F28]|uniref:CARDB domain-containing protein n=1 Tax=Haloarcula salinisoli TaxID=2487746 RepID=UPI001C7307B3|nr:CARDB domain-containing protein [Halomicroarcula salinisoli]MBX0287588.1 hypothetical protein [Halomicroarcula salinisoli]
MRKTALSVLLVAMVVLSGCSALENTGGSQTPSATGTPVETATPTQTDMGMANGSETETPAQFDASVRYPNGGVAGNESIVRIDVENTGGQQGQYNATLTADGEQVATESVTLDGGASTTVSLTHTFETTGQHDLSTGTSSRTIQVYDSARNFTDAAMERVETARIEEFNTVDAAVSANETTFNITAEGSATIRKNYAAETQYRNVTTRTTLFGQTSVERTEEWTVDGTVFSRTIGDDGERDYTREPSDEFEDDNPLENDTVLDYLSTEHTDDEYVFIVETENSAESTELLRSFRESDDESDNSGPSAESIDELYFELRYDRQTGRSTTELIRFNARSGEDYDSFEFTSRREYVAFNETVSVEVPGEVRDRATPVNDSG